MKHLAIPTTLSICCQQPQAAFGKYKCMASGGTFENLAIEAFCAMGIEKTHEIQRYALARANRAGLSNILLSTNIDRSRIS